MGALSIGRRALAVLALVLLAGTTPGPARSQTAARPAAAAEADLSGIWISYYPNNPDPADLKETQARYRAIPDYRPGWAERVAKTWAQSGRGEKIFDAQSDCYPPGLANWFQFIYPTEILMTPGQVTINSEYFNQTRRVYTDGRPHPAPDDLDPSFIGHSIGHWEGQTLVVDTVGLRNTLVSDLRPHSEQLRVTERVRLTAANEMEWTAAMTDPVAFKQPWVFTVRLHRAAPGEQIREMVCEENRTQEKYASPSAAP